MCLASEAGKIETAASQPLDHTAATCTLHVKTKTIVKEETEDAHDLLSSTPASSSTPTETSPPTPSSQTTIVKKKKKKKKDGLREVPKTGDKDKSPGSPKKTIKKRQSSESEMDSVLYTIEAVAKGAWGDMEETFKKKVRSAITDRASPGDPGSPKKNMKPKTKKPFKTKEEQEGEMEEDEDCEHPEPSTVDMEVELTPPSPKSEADEASIGSPEPGSIKELAAPPSPPHIKHKGEERDRERDTEASAEGSGSRKSERSCKGALYKTLVSEGMLTSLRANVDRGMHE